VYAPRGDTEDLWLCRQPTAVWRFRSRVPTDRPQNIRHCRRRPDHPLADLATEVRGHTIPFPLPPSLPPSPFPLLLFPSFTPPSLFPTFHLPSFPPLSLPPPSFFVPRPPHLNPAKGYGEHCKLPSGVRGTAAVANAFLTILTPENTFGDRLNKCSNNNTLLLARYVL